MKILSIDPGIRNFAFSIISDKQDVLLSGHLINTIQNINNEMENEILLYKDAISTVLKKAKLKKDDYIVIERYQSRGHKGTQIEIVNAMIGITGCLFERLILIAPVVWKNYMKKKYGTNDMHKLIKVDGLTPHMADSIGLGSYVMERRLNYENFFTNLLSKEWTWKK